MSYIKLDINLFNEIKKIYEVRKHVLYIDIK